MTMSHLLLCQYTRKFAFCGLLRRLPARWISSGKHTVFKGRRIGISVVGVVVLAGCGTLLWLEVAAVHRRISTSTDVGSIEKKINPYIYFLETRDGVKNQIQRSGWNIKQRIDLDKLSKEPWFPWLQSRSDDPWMLLQLCRSSSAKTRALGIEALATMDSWEDFQYRYIAQAADHRTQVALARMPGIDLRFFRRPPTLISLPQGKNLLRELQTLLSKLPSHEGDRCVQHFTQAAMQLAPPRSDRGHVWGLLGSLPDLLEYQEDSTISRPELACLEALAHQSAVAEQCPQLVQLGLLELLRRLVDRLSQPDLDVDEKKMKKLQCLVARILGNLATQPSLCQRICQAGWVSVLVKWSRVDNLSIRLLAARALFNLDSNLQLPQSPPAPSSPPSNPPPSVLQDGVYLIYPHLHSKGPIHADVVFVHGIHGGALKTWRQSDCYCPDPSDSLSGQQAPQTMCWPLDWLAADCSDVRIIAVDYETQLTQWTAPCPFDQEKRTLAHQSRTLLHKLQAAGVGTRPVIWVGHSLGGLLIKQLLELCVTGEGNSQGEATPPKPSSDPVAASPCKTPDCRSVLGQTVGVMFYGVPHRGVHLADLSYTARRLLHPSVEVLELSADSLKLRSLHQHFQEMVGERGIPCLSFGETKKSSLSRTLPKILIVPPESSDPGVGHFFPLPTDHINICKPMDRDSELYQQSLGFIRQCVLHGRLRSILPLRFFLPDFGMRQSS